MKNYCPVRLNQGRLLVKKLLSAFSMGVFLFAFPASTNYTLRNYAVGGGSGTGTSDGYQIQGQVGEVQALELNGNSYHTLPGLVAAQMAAVPPVPTWQNTASTYNSLHLTLATSDNPTDATYAIAISNDSFSTTQYVQSDGTVGATLGAEDWQTYALWGGASGSDVIGLTPNTTYQVKVKAKHGDFTESGWGPTASAATSTLALSFDIDVASTDTESSAPYTLALGNLVAGSVTTSNDQVWIDLATNAAHGATVYVYGTNAGLYSAEQAHTISAVSGNLTSLSEGFGLQVASASNLTGQSPFDGSEAVVGVVNATPQPIFAASAPVTAGRGSFVGKAKITNLTPASSDYTELLTAVAAASF